MRYEPFVVAVGFSNAALVYDWVADTWKNKFARKSGSLVVTDYKLEAKREREFLNALLDRDEPSPRSTPRRRNRAS